MKAIVGSPKGVEDVVVGVACWGVGPEPVPPLVAVVLVLGNFPVITRYPTVKPTRMKRKPKTAFMCYLLFKVEVEEQIPTANDRQCHKDNVVCTGLTANVAWVVWTRLLIPHGRNWCAYDVRSIKALCGNSRRR